MAAHLLLAEQAFSRNKNYDAYRDPRFRSAIALYRRLRALLTDLDRAVIEEGSLLVIEETHAGRASVRLDLKTPRTRRSLWLDKPAWEVLLQHPRARETVRVLER